MEERVEVEMQKWMLSFSLTMGLLPSVSAPRLQHSITFLGGRQFIANFNQEMINCESDQKIDESRGIYYFSKIKEDLVCMEYLALPKGLKKQSSISDFMCSKIDDGLLPEGLNLKKVGKIDIFGLRPSGPEVKFLRAHCPDAELNERVYLAFLEKGVLVVRIQSPLKDYELFFRHKALVLSAIGVINLYNLAPIKDWELKTTKK